MFLSNAICILAQARNARHQAIRSFYSEVEYILRARKKTCCAVSV